MLVTKIAFTALVLCAVLPLLVAPFHHDFRPKNWQNYDWFDWTIIGSVVMAMAAAILFVLALTWGI